MRHHVYKRPCLLSGIGILRNPPFQDDVGVVSIGANPNSSTGVNVWTGCSASRFRFVPMFTTLRAGFAVISSESSA
jgi:hypothetical protein